MHLPEALKTAEPFRPANLPLDCYISECREEVKDLDNAQRQTVLGELRTVVSTKPHSIRPWLKLLMLLPLEEAPAVLNEIRDENNDTILHYCAQTHPIEALREIVGLLEGPTHLAKAIQAEDRHGNSVLAVLAGNPDGFPTINHILARLPQENRTLIITKETPKGTLLHWCAEKAPTLFPQILALLPEEMRLDAVNKKSCGKTPLHVLACSNPEILLPALKKLPGSSQCLDAVSQQEGESNQTVLHLVATCSSFVLLNTLMQLPDDERWDVLQVKDARGSTILELASIHCSSKLSTILQSLLESPNVPRQAMQSPHTLKVEDDFLSNLNKLRSCFASNSKMDKKCQETLQRLEHFNKLRFNYQAIGTSIFYDLTLFPDAEKTALKNLTQTYRAFEKLAICMQPGEITPEFSQTIDTLKQYAAELKQLVLNHSLALRMILTIGGSVGAMIGGVIAGIIGLAAGVLVGAMVGLLMAVMLAGGPATPSGQLAILLCALSFGVVVGIQTLEAGIKIGTYYGERLAYQATGRFFLKSPQSALYECAELALTHADLARNSI